LVSRGENAFPTASNRAAACGRIAFDDRRPVFCSRRQRTTGAVGALQETNSVSLCVPDARGRHVKKTRDVSKVQDEVGQETDRQGTSYGFKLA
jgi:hypothetical protein